MRNISDYFIKSLIKFNKNLKKESKSREVRFKISLTKLRTKWHTFTILLY